RPGEYPFRVRATVSGLEDVYTEASGSVSVTEPAATQPRQRPQPSPQPPPTPRPSASPVLPPELTLSPRSTFRFGPGEVATPAVITVQNKSSLIERYQIQILGLPEEWYNLDRAEVSLQPGASVQVPLRLTPKPGPSFPAGDYPFQIRVAPHSFPESFAEIGAIISIIGVAAFDARLTPAQTQGRKEKYKLTLVNTGAVPLSLWMEGTDPGGACKFKFPPPPTLEPGQEAVVPVWLGARRNGLVGKPETYDFRLRVLPAGAQSGAAKSFDARLVHQPFLTPRFAALSLLLAALITVIGVILALGTSSVSSVSAWVKCNMDDDFQEVRGGPVLIKEDCGGAPIPEQKGTPVAASPTPPPAATPSPTTQPPQPAACTPTGTIAVGMQVTVVSSTNIRQAPGLQGQIIRTIRADTPASVTAGHQCADNLTWWRVNLGDVEGWAAEVDPNGVVLVRPR
ncbi:MAG TPA: SH3 domain-containing protein, partial [Dehalococcoidia bacterium]|nr:SH3 domain-containing protein [Dehalococcoidia bacterium]